MEWSLGLEPWSGVLEWIQEWNIVRYGIIVALRGQELVLIDQFLNNAYLYEALYTLCFFAICGSHTSIKL